MARWGMTGCMTARLFDWRQKQKTNMRMSKADGVIRGRRGGGGMRMSEAGGVIK